MQTSRQCSSHNLLVHRYVVCIPLVEAHLAHDANDSSRIASMSNSANFSLSDSTDLLLVVSVSEETCLGAHSSVAIATKQLSRAVWPFAVRISFAFSGILVAGSSSSMPISLRKFKSSSSPSGCRRLSARISSAVILRAVEWAM